MPPEPALLPESEGINQVTVVSHTVCRIGVWGLFDVDEYGAMVDAMIVRQELLRRLPAADVRLFAPFGHLRPCRFDGGEAVEPLGLWGDRRREQLAAQLDCVVVSGSGVTRADADLSGDYGVTVTEMARLAPSRFFVEGLGPDLEDSCPMAWHGVAMADPVGPDEAERLRTALASRRSVAVRDDATKRLLQAAGVDCHLEDAPDSALLLPGLFPAEILDKRLDYLRLMGWYPREGRAVVVAARGTMLEWAPELAASLADRLAAEDDLSVVVAELGSRHGEAEFSSSLASSLPPERVFRLSAAGSADVAAAIAACAGLVGSSRAEIVTALAFGRPTLMLGDRDGLVELARRVGRLDGPVLDPSSLAETVEGLLAGEPDPQALDVLKAQVAASFDRIAATADAASRARLGSSSDDRIAGLESRLTALQEAYRVRGDRLFAERVVLADRVSALTNEAARYWRQLNDEAPRRIAAEAEVEAVHGTRTFRWTARARSVYHRLRRPAR